MSDQTAFNKKVERIRNKVFPMKLKNGYYCDNVPHAELTGFLQRHFSVVFPNINDSSKFNNRNLSQSRQRNRQIIVNHYGNLHHDYIVFCNKNHKKIGWFFGEIEDPQTYYMRNTGILPKHQGKGLYLEFLMGLCAYLNELGFERISSQHHGDNPKVLIPKLKAGFTIVGMENHENWGSLIKLVKHLKKDRQKSYQQKFN